MDHPGLRFYPGQESDASLRDAPLRGEEHNAAAQGSTAASGGGPLARFLPPLPPGMAAAWLAENAPPGSWLLDPLGASPALTLEAARAGYSVLVASNNPILSFITETLARAPRGADFQSALAELAMTRRGEEHLQHHLQNLYLTNCDSCGEAVQAQTFVWRKDEAQPFARVYECAKCGQSGEHPITQPDLERLKALGGDKLQRSRALQRVILNEDAHRADVEETLENYLPRSLYVLFTLANKLEGLGLPPERARLLQALLISTFDQGNTLWPWPGGRSRPKQLSVPPQFRENNLWLALEDAVKEWTQQPRLGLQQPRLAQAQPGPIPVTRWPELPPAGTGGICLFRGRVKALMPLPDTIRLGAVVTVFPRPNQAFWTLSALWSGWLWGAEAALPMLNVLDRRRYDWNWHTTAIHSALAAVAGNLPSETPLFGLLPELVPGFLSAVVTAASAAGFALDGLALRGEQEAVQGLVAQGLWRPTGSQAATARPEEMDSAARNAMLADLQARGEPASYLALYAAGLVGMARAGALPRGLSSIPADLLNRVQASLARTFADRSLLKVYGPADEERGAWWLANAPAPSGELPGVNMPGVNMPGANMPLADQVEIEVVRFLQKQPPFPFAALEEHICTQFPGLRTPPAGLVRACLESYGEPVPSQLTAPGTRQILWRMRENETAAVRKADLQDIRTVLANIGQRLGYTPTTRGQAETWEANGAPAWWFYPMASSIASRYVYAAPEGGQRALVIPGSRAQLVRYKLRHDPRLAEMVQNGWRFIKFRHLRDIAVRADLSHVTWESLLDEDPLTDEAVQMQLFG